MTTSKRQTIDVFFNTPCVSISTSSGRPPTCFGARFDLLAVVIQEERKDVYMGSFLDRRGNGRGKQAYIPKDKENEKKRSAPNFLNRTRGGGCCPGGSFTIKQAVVENMHM